VQRNKLANQSPKQRYYHVSYKHCMFVLENESIVNFGLNPGNIHFLIFSRKSLTFNQIYPLCFFFPVFVSSYLPMHFV